MPNPTDNTPGETRTGSYAHNRSARPLGKRTGRMGNVPPDTCNSTGFDPLTGTKSSRINRQPKRGWHRGRR